eukprot:scaffold25732_cov95-Isochrysis_galbana.AAC.2
MRHVPTCAGVSHTPPLAHWSSGPTSDPPVFPHLLPPPVFVHSGCVKYPLVLRYMPFVLRFLLRLLPEAPPPSPPTHRYACYALAYQKHRSWYSWLLRSTVGCVYTFGAPRSLSPPHARPCRI